MADKLKIDFSGVPEEIRKGGGKAKHIPEGDYLAKIVEGEVRDNKAGTSRYISWKFQITRGEHKGVTCYGSTSLKPEALWSLRNLIHAATGKNVAGKAMNLDIEKLYGKEVGITVEDNEYTKDGTTKVTSQVSTCFPPDEFEADDEEDTEDDDDPEVEEVEETEDEDLEDVDVEEL